jgi:hypothetical protein
MLLGELHDDRQKINTNARKPAQSIHTRQTRFDERLTDQCAGVLIAFVMVSCGFPN